MKAHQKAFEKACNVDKNKLQKALKKLNECLSTGKSLLDFQAYIQQESHPIKSQMSQM